MVTLTNISWGDVIQLLAFILSSGVLAFAVTSLRGVLHIPDNKVPEVVHGVAVAITILIAICTSLASGQPITWTMITAAILAGIAGANTAAGIHANLKTKAEAAAKPVAFDTSGLVFPQVGPAAQVATPPPQPPATTP